MADSELPRGKVKQELTLGDQRRGIIRTVTYPGYTDVWLQQLVMQRAGWVRLTAEELDDLHQLAQAARKG